MVYFRCPSICNLTLNGVVESIRPMNLVPGRDYEIVTVSFDPRENHELAKAKKETYLKELGKPEFASGWHFLSSPRPAAGKTLGEALGFGFKLDPKGEQYLHEAAIYLCTPEGRVAQTVRGVQYESDMLHYGLVKASEGKISQGLFGVALSCGLVHFDPNTGKYTWAMIAVMRLTGIVTVLLVATVIGTLIYRDSKRRQASHLPVKE